VSITFPSYTCVDCLQDITVNAMSKMADSLETIVENSRSDSMSQERSTAEGDETKFYF